MPQSRLEAERAIAETRVERLVTTSVAKLAPSSSDVAAIARAEVHKEMAVLQHQSSQAPAVVAQMAVLQRGAEAQALQLQRLEQAMGRCEQQARHALQLHEEQRQLAQQQQQQHVQHLCNLADAQAKLEQEVASSVRAQRELALSMKELEKQVSEATRAAAKLTASQSAAQDAGALEAATQLASQLKGEMSNELAKWQAKCEDLAAAVDDRMQAEWPRGKGGGHLGRWRGSAVTVSYSVGEGVCRSLVAVWCVPRSLLPLKSASSVPSALSEARVLWRSGGVT